MGSFYLNLSFSCVLGRKLRTRLGGMSRRDLVIGLTEIRSAFVFTSKVPNPWMAIVLPSSHRSVMHDKRAETSRLVSLVEWPVRRASSVMKSLLFKGNRGLGCETSLQGRQFAATPQTICPILSLQGRKKVEIIGTDYL